MRSIFAFAAMALAAAFITPKLFEYGRTIRPELPSVATNVAAPALETAPAPSSSRRVVIAPDGQGHFRVEARVDGNRLGFMIDTGASMVALTESDAARLGVRPRRDDFTATVKTANGSVKGALATLRSVEVDGITVRDVRALVLPDDALSENLLGLSFLSRLHRFEYARGKLVLEQ